MKAPFGVPGTSVVRHDQVMGTVVTFDVRTPEPQPQVDEALAAVTRWLHWVDGPSARTNRTAK